MTTDRIAMRAVLRVDWQRRLARQRVRDLALAVDGLLHGVELEGGTVAIVGVVLWRAAEVTAEGPWSQVDDARGPVAQELVGLAPQRVAARSPPPPTRRRPPPPPRSPPR